MALSRRSLLLVASLVVIALTGVAYLRSGPRPAEPGAEGTSGREQPIAVSVSRLFVTVENRAKMPIVDVKVAIAPAGRATIFSASVARMETSEKRDFSFGDFRGRDGTPFNLRIHKPRSVTVTAQGIDGTPIEVEVPW